jgi:DNA-binding LytR/AlgR family response regulator
MASTVNDKVNLSGLRVLIVEDDALAALDVAESVEAFGGEVLGPVAAAAEGVALLRRIRPHMALLDVQLRDGFVTPLATALEQLEVPYALVSGYRGQELEKSVLRRVPQLAKPYSRSDLARMAALLCKKVVRRRAYAIWEREGRPEGEADRHWSMARKELQAPSNARPVGSANPLRHENYAMF